MEFTIPLLFFFLVIIPSAVLHEYAHGWMADRLGDPTPRLAGRLTINPLPHIDPVGTLLLPFLLFLVTRGSFLFAYAKPVPFNPLALRFQRWGAAAVGAAGPLANFIVALVLGLVVRFLPLSNFSLLLTIVIYANILLAVFNLVPIAPLDGSKLLYALLPDRYYKFKIWLERYGFFILLFFMFYLFDWLLSPIVFFFLNIFAGQAGMILLLRAFGT